MAISDVIELAEFEAALGSGMKALSHIANYELEGGIQERMRELGERKEFLSESEHEELMALVDFSQRRQSEKLEAEVALKQLGKFVPEMTAS